MIYQVISSSLTSSGKAAIQSLFSLIKSNFLDHQQRINNLENFVTPVPVGSVVSYPAASLPSGFLSCDGSAISRSTYSALFALIGTTWGSGDGATTFNLPNAEDCTVMASGTTAGLTTRTVGQTVGSATHTLTTSELPIHTHTPSDPGHTHNFSDTGDNDAAGSLRRVFAGTGSPLLGVQTIYNETSGISIGSEGSGAAHNNMQPYLATQFIIKT